MTLPSWTPVRALPVAHGIPPARGRLRVRPDDFEVDEVLGFEPDGEGDHLLLRVRKTGSNTEWVARRLARIAAVPAASVGYAGLKDRHAVTLQWFSIPRSRDANPVSPGYADAGFEVLEVHRHRRKLKRGALAGNRFRILARDVAPDHAPDLDRRLAAVRRRGVPNYFGEQRFGHDASNLRGADALFAGTAGRVPRHRSGIWISAARSQIFNEVLAERVRRDDWDRPSDGDCMQLAGSHSYFATERIAPEMIDRCDALDIHPTGPLWGHGALPSGGAVRGLEERTAAAFPLWCAGLARLGLAQERRALRVPVGDLSAEWVPPGLRLAFSLPAGSYATTVLRELLDCDDSGGCSGDP